MISGRSCWGSRGSCRFSILISLSLLTGLGYPMCSQLAGERSMANRLKCMTTDGHYNARGHNRIHDAGRGRDRYEGRQGLRG
jgi:hypothetical protein